MYRLDTAHSSFCSVMMAPTRRMMAASLGNMPTTLVRRLISLLTRSRGLVEWICLQWSLGEYHEGEHILFGVAHHGGEFWEPSDQGVYDLAPLGDGGLMILLHEGSADGGGDHEALSLADMGQGVPHEVNPAALPGCAEHLGGGCLETLVGIRDDQLDAAQATPRQGA